MWHKGKKNVDTALVLFQNQVREIIKNQDKKLEWVDNGLKELNYSKNFTYSESVLQYLKIKKEPPPEAPFLT